MSKQKEDEVQNVITDKASRALQLSEVLRDDFDRIKTFGNFNQSYFYNFYHSFYSLAVAYAANRVFNDENIKFQELDFENTELYGEGSKKRAINSEQLRHHDHFFTAIAYWYLMKKEDPKPYRVLIRKNLARQICEGFFIKYWEDFKDTIKNFNSSYPNIQLVDIIPDIFK